MENKTARMNSYGPPGSPGPRYLQMAIHHVAMSTTPLPYNYAGLVCYLPKTTMSLSAVYTNEHLDDISRHLEEILRTVDRIADHLSISHGHNRRVSPSVSIRKRRRVAESSSDEDLPLKRFKNLAEQEGLSDSGMFSRIRYCYST